jgi:hypothetical protein
VDYKKTTADSKNFYEFLQTGISAHKSSAAVHEIFIFKKFHVFHRSKNPFFGIAFDV